jgi:predicted dehydrogenase
MDAEARHADQKLVFGFNHRHHPATLEAKAIVEAGTLGRILWLRGVYGKSGGLGDDFESSWRNDPAISGGGILLDQGIHMLDLFRFFCGDFDEILSVCATSFWDVPVEDNAMVLLRARTGSVAQLHSSSTLWRHTFRLEIGLEGGYLIVEGLLSRSGTYGRETLVIGRKPRQEEVHLVGTPREEIQYFDEDLSWHLQVEGLLNCIKEKRPVQDSTSLDALRVMEIISEVYATASLTNQSPSLNPAEAQ